MKHPPRSLTLLMTATIAPHNNPDAHFEVAERRRQYLDAFAFYLKHLAQNTYDRLLFCENSGDELEDFRAMVPANLLKRVYFLCAPPEIFPAYLRKSNEFLLIDYACDHCPWLREDNAAFFKVTGRYRTLNIAALINDVHRAGLVDFYCDQKDHRLYSRLGLNWCQQNGEMRYIYMTVDFWRKHFYGYFTKHPEYRAVEEIVFEVARTHYNDSSCRFRFRHEARFRGFQGQQAAFLGMRFSPMMDYLTSDLRWALAAFLRRLFPRWWF